MRTDGTDITREVVDPTAVPRSRAAAALLNLTGIGLGYAYLRHWVRAALCATGAVLLVVVAFATDAASAPWLWRGIAAAWLAGTAFDAWWLARRSPRPPTRLLRVRPVAVGVVCVAVVVAGYLGYGAAGRATYVAGLAAQGRADCQSANLKFDTVTGPYALTLSQDVQAATARRTECLAFETAELAELQGDYAAAVAAYQGYRRDFPGTVLIPFAHENLKRTFGAWASSLRRSGDLDGAIRVYRDLLQETGGEPEVAQARDALAATYVERADHLRTALPGAAGQARVDLMRSAVEDLLLVGRELGDTPTAAGVPQAVVDTFTAANSLFTEQKFCDALPVLDYAVTLPDAETAGVVGAANANRPQALLECGLANFRSGGFTGAVTRLDTLATAYPNDPGTAQARSGVIAAKVAQQSEDPVPLPAPLDSPGSNPVLFYNATSDEVHVLLTGCRATWRMAAERAGEKQAVTTAGRAAAAAGTRPDSARR